MDIFESTLKLKDYFYKNNQQLIKIKDNIELSGFSPLPILSYYGKANTINDYEKNTHIIKGGRNFLYNKNKYITHRKIKDSSLIQPYEITSENVDVKEYWNFLHKEFKYCDVCSYYNVTNLKQYYKAKGPHYDSIIKELGGIEFFKDKKILEIGPGYGYLPKILKDNHIEHKYYCADIVKRFEHENFIDINGYSLSNISDKFDIIIMYDVLQHLDSYIYKKYALEIKNLLNDNGCFLLSGTLNNKENYNSYFFSQMYDNIGMNDLLNYMNEIEFNFTWWKPIMVKDTNIGNVLKFQLNKNLN